ncbi:hypothetical protein BN1013_01998 [Candidatus Rubidus massiliensis]|nr:hypothetical protein BN1013_01998 [Candidatus Rubidus massiliensis]
MQYLPFQPSADYNDNSRLIFENFITSFNLTTEDKVSKIVPCLIDNKLIDRLLEVIRHKYLPSLPQRTYPEIYKVSLYAFMILFSGKESAKSIYYEMAATSTINCEFFVENETNNKKITVINLFHGVLFRAFAKGEFANLLPCERTDKEGLLVSKELELLNEKCLSFYYQNEEGTNNEISFNKVKTIFLDCNFSPSKPIFEELYAELINTKATNEVSYVYYLGLHYFEEGSFQSIVIEQQVENDQQIFHVYLAITNRDIITFQLDELLNYLKAYERIICESKRVTDFFESKIFGKSFSFFKSAIPNTNFINNLRSLFEVD